MWEEVGEMCTEVMGGRGNDGTDINTALRD